jgi:hypothetical protein
VESPVQPARLSNPHHRSGGRGIEHPAALPAAASPNLGKVCSDASFHALILIRLRYKFKRICNFPASTNLEIRFRDFPFEHNQDDLGRGRAKVLGSVLQGNRPGLVLANRDVERESAA